MAGTAAKGNSATGNCQDTTAACSSGPGSTAAGYWPDTAPPGHSLANSQAPVTDQAAARTTRTRHKPLRYVIYAYLYTELQLKRNVLLEQSTAARSSWKLCWKSCSIKDAKSVSLSWKKARGNTKGYYEKPKLHVYT